MALAAGSTHVHVGKRGGSMFKTMLQQGGFCRNLAASMLQVSFHVLPPCCRCLPGCTMVHLAPTGCRSGRLLAQSARWACPLGT